MRRRGTLARPDRCHSLLSERQSAAPHVGLRAGAAVAKCLAGPAARQVTPRAGCGLVRVVAIVAPCGPKTSQWCHKDGECAMGRGPWVEPRPGRTARLACTPPSPGFLARGVLGLNPVLPLHLRVPPAARRKQLADPSLPLAVRPTAPVLAFVPTSCPAARRPSPALVAQSPVMCRTLRLLLEAARSAPAVHLPGLPA